MYLVASVRLSVRPSVHLSLDNNSYLGKYYSYESDQKPYLGPQPEVCYLACLFGTLPILSRTSDFKT